MLGLPAQAGPAWEVAEGIAAPDSRRNDDVEELCVNSGPGTEVISAWRIRL